MLSQSLPRYCAGGNQWPWTALRLVLSAVLAAAVAIKALNSSRILAGDGILGNTAMLMGAVLFESVASVVILMAGDRLAWRTSLLTFGLLSLFALYATVTGTKCNCFSDAGPARLMLSIDIAAICFLIVFRPSGGRSAWAFNGATLAVVATMVGGAALMTTVVNSKAPLKSNDLLADRLVGEKWPLNSQLNKQLTVLETGTWLIIVARQNCDHCEKLVEQYFADPFFHRPEERTAIFIAKDDLWLWQLDVVSMQPTSPESVRWKEGEPFFASPAVFMVSEGIVTAAADGDGSEHFLQSIIGGVNAAERYE